MDTLPPCKRESSANGFERCRAPQLGLAENYFRARGSTAATAVPLALGVYLIATRSRATLEWRRVRIVRTLIPCVVSGLLGYSPPSTEVATTSC